MAIENAIIGIMMAVVMVSVLTQTVQATAPTPPSTPEDPEPPEDTEPWPTPPEDPEIGLANLYGAVTNANTGSYMQGVKVTVDSFITYSNVGGEYVFEDLSPESYSIMFEKDDYETVISTAILAAGNNELNIQMTPTIAPEPSDYLIELQSSLARAFEDYAINPDSWVMVPVYGIQTVTDAISLFKLLMIEEAVNIDMIGSSNDVYFIDAIMYFNDGTTVVPYWWQCPYGPEKFRSPELLLAHLESVHWPVIHAGGTILTLNTTTRGEGDSEDVTGFTTSWRNDSAFSITGRIVVEFRTSGSWEYIRAGSKDTTLNQGQSTAVSFDVNSFGADSMRELRAILYLLPSMKILDNYP